MTAFHCVDERALFEDEFAVFVRLIASDVLLKVGVLVIINANARVSRSTREVLNQTRFSHRSRSLKQNGVSKTRENRGNFTRKKIRLPCTDDSG